MRDLFVFAKWTFGRAPSFTFHGGVAQGSPVSNAILCLSVLVK